MNQEKKYGVCVVADDDIGFLDDLCAGLRARNVFKSVMPFARIDEAIAYIRTHSVALFVSDIEFPDGELSYNHLSLIPSVPVILLTVHGRYFMDHFSSIAVNRNIIGTALKIAFPDISQEVVRRYELVKSEGLDKSVIKETATNTIIELYRFDTVNPRSFEVKVQRNSHDYRFPSTARSAFSPKQQSTQILSALQESAGVLCGDGPFLPRSFFPDSP